MLKNRYLVKVYGNVGKDREDELNRVLNLWAKGDNPVQVIVLQEGEALDFDTVEYNEEPGVAPSVPDESIWLDQAYHILSAAEYGRLKWLEQIYIKAVDICARGDNLPAWFTGVAQADINSRRHAILEERP